MKTALALIAAALLSGFQDPPAKDDFQAEVKALRVEYQKADQEYYRPVREAKTAEERKAIKLDPALAPAPLYLEKFKELAERAKGTEGGAAALIEVFGLAQRVPKKSDEARKALAALASDHLASPLMEKVATSLRYAGYSVGDEPCRTALEAIRDKSPHPKAKAAAIFILAIQGMNKDQSASRTSFIRLKKEFGETPYAAKADAFLFELDHLQVGKTAPDFEASDEKGVKWKLSDYRGKVTVIDFWGFW